MKKLYPILLIAYLLIALYTDRYAYKLDVHTWYTWEQVNQFIILLLVTILLNGWVKVLSFAILSLCFVELGQQLLHDNTTVDISDNVSLIIVAAGVVGFVLLRRYKNRL